MFSTRLTAILQALFVTFLWSTSWVLIKIGLDDIPALTFAGLRYALAFLVILLVTLRSGQLNTVRTLTRPDWIWLGTLGLVFYTMTQGTQFLTLVHLPAITFSLMLNFSAVFVAFAGIFLLAEKPSRQQWIGTSVFLLGVLIYFYPVDIPTNQHLGLAIGSLSVLSNAAAALLGRHINREARLPARLITLVSMGIGSAVLLIIGLITQGLPSLSLTNWLIIFWLAIVNTAFAFTLWNHTLRTLSAVESSIINNTMLIQIALLAWLFLDEAITLQTAIGMVVASLGILLVQLRTRENSK